MGSEILSFLWQDVLPFGSTRAHFGEFSKFVRFPSVFDGKIYQTSRHYFQSQKFPGLEKDEEDIRVFKEPPVRNIRTDLTQVFRE